MKKIYAALALATALTGSAMAACPQIEGKYDYQCTVEKDQAAEFSLVLEGSGQMMVQQKGCDSFKFTNLKTQVTEDFDLTDVESTTERSKSTVHKSNTDIIKFKTVEHRLTPNLGLESFSASVTLGSIRKKKDGFTLKGRERSRVLGIFLKKHAKFSCRFTEQK